MMESQHIIHKDKSLIDALNKINTLNNVPLVLFVIDDNYHMVGTLTDGDSRRALISGANIEDSVESAMHCDFISLRNNEVSNNVRRIRELRNRNISLIPILDDNKCIVDIIDLSRKRNSLPIDAVLMAGGKGERLRPLTETLPKPLLPLAGKPIIDIIIDHILSYGIRDIHVTTNYLHEQLDKHFHEPINGIKVKTVQEPRYLGTIGSILFINEFKNDTILLMNSDAITDLDLEDFYLHFKECNADMSVAAVPYNISVPYGILDTDKSNIIGILEKPTYNYYVNSGIYLIKRDLLHLIPKNTFYNATDFIDELIRNRYKVIRFPLNGTWLDIGSPQEYQKAKELVKYMK